MTKNQLAAQLQGLVSKLISLEAEALMMGEGVAAEDIQAAHYKVGMALRRVEPPWEVRDAMLVISVNSNATQEVKS